MRLGRRPIFCAGWGTRGASIPHGRSGPGCSQRAGRLRARARVEESVGQAVALAATEACSNVVVHAYREQEEPGKMTIAVEKRGASLWTVIDDGLGIAPRPDSPGLGMGLALISEISDALGLRSRPEGGTHVNMRFDLTHAPG